ncbi:hypothetical protein CB1_001938002 [Camelus ferus]|nr:hypothetical protein CB1_001938002 [Camelus ferus]
MSYVPCDVQYLVLQYVATMSIKCPGIPDLHSQHKQGLCGSHSAITECCATNISQLDDICLNDLVQLLSRCVELRVTESVVIMKKLPQKQPAQHEIIKHLPKLTDNIQGRVGTLSHHAKKLFLAPKPAPALESSFKDGDHFQMGSVSHLLNAKATSYQKLTDWPEEAPDSSVHNLEVPECTN